MTTHLFRWTQFAAGNAVRVAGILLVAFLLTRLLKALTQRLIKRAASETRVAQMREQQTRTQAAVLYSAGTALILIVAFLMVLPEFGFNVTPIAALAGLASVALGFGAQHVVRDVINGFFIVFEDQYVVGDTVRTGDVVGRVEHLTLRRTLLRDDKGALVTMANGEIRQVANLSRDWSQLFVDVQIAAEEAVDAALAALEKVSSELRTDPAWSAALVDGPRVLGVEALALAGTTLRMQVRTAPNRQYDVARELRRRIGARFEQEQIRLSGVQRVELVGSERYSESDSRRSR
ncbi:MAG: mechanosensitive ion channel family protein [Acidobacteria bacterium]|nr:mechanosensitive ion channel family protein [Acidobacteriota bacterium]